MLGGGYQARDRLVDGDRCENDHGQSHAPNRARADGGDAGEQPEPDRDAGRQAGQERPQSGPCGRAGLGPRQTSIDRRHLLQPRLGGAGHEKLRRACEDLQGRRCQLSARAGDPTLASVGEVAREDRYQEGHEQQGGGKNESGSRHQEPDQGYGACGGDAGDEVGEQEAQPQVG